MFWVILDISDDFGHLGASWGGQLWEKKWFKWLIGCWYVVVRSFWGYSDEVRLKISSVRKAKLHLQQVLEREIVDFGHFGHLRASEGRGLWEQKWFKWLVGCYELMLRPIWGYLEEIHLKTRSPKKAKMHFCRGKKCILAILVISERLKVGGYETKSDSNGWWDVISWWWGHFESILMKYALKQALQRRQKCTSRSC